MVRTPLAHPGQPPHHEQQQQGQWPWVHRGCIGQGGRRSRGGGGGHRALGEVAGAAGPTAKGGGSQQSHRRGGLPRGGPPGVAPRLCTEARGVCRGAGQWRRGQGAGGPGPGAGMGQPGRPQAQGLLEGTLRCTRRRGPALGCPSHARDGAWGAPWVGAWGRGWCGGRRGSRPRGGPSGLPLGRGNRGARRTTTRSTLWTRGCARRTSFGMRHLADRFEEYPKLKVRVAVLWQCSWRGNSTVQMCCHPPLHVLPPGLSLIKQPLVSFVSGGVPYSRS